MTNNPKILTASGLLFVAFFVLDIAVPLGFASGFGYLLILLLSTWIRNKRSTVVLAAIALVLIISGYFITELNIDAFEIQINRLMAFASVWVVAGFVLWHKSFSSDILDRENRYSILFESAVESIFIVDKDGQITDLNKASETLFGYKKSELLGNSIELLIPKHFRGTHVEKREDFILEKTSRKMVEHPGLYGLTKNGMEFPIEISLSRIENGNTSCVMAIVSDVSEKRRTINSLKASELKYRALFETMSQGVIYINSNGLVTSANPAANNIIGFSIEETNGVDRFKTHGASIYPDGSDYSLEEYPGIVAMKTGKAVIGDIMGVFNPIKKEYVWISINAIPQFKEGEIKPYQVYATFEDITERKSAQDRLKELNVELERRVDARSKALEESQEMYKMIARNFPNGVMNVLDRDLNYIFAEGMEMYKRGITSETMIGTSFIDRINPEIQDEIESQLLTVFKGDNVDFELKTDGRTYMIYAVGLVNHDNEVDQILMVSQNVTGLKKAEEDTSRALEKERHLNELKSRFVSMASHEFRTPLTTTLNSLNLLAKYIRMDGMEEKQERHIDRIKGSVAHLMSTLNDFLSLDKLEEGKINVHYSEFDLALFAEEAIEDMAGLLKTDQKIIHNHEGPTKICLDKMMLKNIFNNLLSNAVKYSPEGSSVALDTKIEGDWFTVIVKDQGIGIPAEDQAHLFERFFRANNALELQGTGLGLNIIKKYTEMVKGDISFESTMNKGSKFKVELPIHNHKCCE